MQTSLSVGGARTNVANNYFLINNVFFRDARSQTIFRRIILFALEGMQKIVNLTLSRPRLPRFRNDNLRRAVFHMWEAHIHRFTEVETFQKNEKLVIAHMEWKASVVERN